MSDTETAEDRLSPAERAHKRSVLLEEFAIAEQELWDNSPRYRTLSYIKRAIERLDAADEKANRAVQQSTTEGSK